MKKLDMKRAIREHGLRSVNIAERLGITPASISQRLSTDNPTLNTMMEIAGILGCDVTDMFYDDDADEERQEEACGEHAPEVAEEKENPMVGAVAFCPHCGKRVKVGVVLLEDE